MSHPLVQGAAAAFASAAVSINAAAGTWHCGATRLAAFIADALAVLSPDDAEDEETVQALSVVFAAIARELGA